MLANRRDMVKTRQPAVDGGSPLSQEKFWQLWEEHRPFLYKLCLYWMKGDAAEAREALSGAMMRALDGTTGKLPVIGNIRAWLARVVRNHCIDLLRQQKRLPYEVEDPDRLLERLDEGRILIEASPEAGMVRQERYLQVLQALEALPTRLREVMMLRAYQNMPFKDIAHHLCITPANARKRATEARTLLSRRLRADENDVRANRSADPSARPPRGERRAADAILERPVVPEPEAMHYAHPCQIQLEGGRSIERFLFLSRRPTRIGQRLRTLEGYMDRHPSGWTKCHEYAGLLCIEGRFQEAIFHYREVLRRQPQRFQVGESLARCLQVMGQEKEAVQILRSVLTTVRNSAHGAHLGALQASIEGDHRRALAGWTEACQLAPGHLHYVLALAGQQLRMGRSQEAKITLLQHLHRHPMDREGHALLLKALNELNDRQGYASVLQQTVRKFPEDLLATAQTVMFAMRTHKAKNKAVKELGKMITLLRAHYPQAALAMHVRAAWLFHRGKFDQCRTTVHQFISQQPHLREGLRYAAYWLDCLGDRDLAAQYLDDLNRLFPKAGREMELQNLNTWQNR